jgi:surface antigen
VCGTPGTTGDIPQFGELSVPSLAGAGFSPQAASMLTEIGNVTNTHASSSSVVAAVTGVQNSAGAKLSPAEASAVAAAGSVAISSAEYWEANAEKWRGSVVDAGCTSQANQYNRSGRDKVGGHPLPGHVPRSPRIAAVG